METTRGMAAETPWWSRRAFLAVLVLLMLVPFVALPVIPLFDLPGHMGRYQIEIDGGRSPFLSRWWSLHWTVIGNLGVDLLVMPLGGLIGVERAARLVVGAIPALTAAGWLWIARERHGTVPPTAAFALPLALGYPFQFGFVNFALSMALAMLAFGLWLRLGRLGQERARGGLFLAIAPLVWIAHVYGWAVLGLLCLAAEWEAARRPGRRLAGVAIHAVRGCLPLALPVLLILIWRSDTPAETTGFLQWHAKIGWLLSALRDHWKPLDGDSAELLIALLAAGWLGLMRVDRVLGPATLLLALAYLALPEELMGSHYADMRMAPTLLAIALLALAPRGWMSHGMRGMVAGAALAFLLVRLCAAMASFQIHAAEQARHIAAIDHIPVGARLYTLVAPPCGRDWDGPRLDHIASLAIIRRQAFVNDQWVDPGAQVIRVRLPIPADYASSPSQLARLSSCPRPEPTIDERLARFPRDRFDLVWLIGPPPAARPSVPGLTPLWANEAGALYRIDRP